MTVVRNRTENGQQEHLKEYRERHQVRPERLRAHLKAAWINVALCIGGVFRQGREIRAEEQRDDCGVKRRGSPILHVPASLFAKRILRLIHYAAAVAIELR